MEKLVLWHEMDGVGDKSKELVEYVCEKTSEKTNTDISAETINIKDFIVNLNKIKDGGKSPDIALIPQDMLYLENGLMSNVGEEYKINIDDEIWDTMKYKNEQKGIPFLRGNHIIMFYNKKCYNGPIRDWKDVQKSCKNNYCSCKIKKSVAMLKEPYWLMPFICTMSTVEFGSDYINVDPCGMQKAIDYVLELEKNKTITMYDEINDMHTAFAEGKIGALLTGEWVYGYLFSQLGDNLGVCTLPSIDGNIMTGISTTVGMVFPNNAVESDKKCVIDKYVELMLSDDIQRRWFNDYKRLPITNNIYSEISKNTDENWSEMIKQMNKNQMIYNSTALFDFWKYMDKIVVCLEDKEKVQKYSKLITELGNKK